MLSIRHDYFTGCFALYKNKEFINHLFKKSRDYKKVLSSTKHYCFDECNFAHDLLTEGRSILDIDTEIQSFTEVIKISESKNEIKSFFDFLLIEGRPGDIKFEEGRIFYKDKYEGILYHLIHFKHEYTPVEMPVKIPEVFYISKDKIFFNQN